MSSPPSPPQALAELPTGAPPNVLVVGAAGVGKSALINRLVGKKKTKSENRPGVTRGFTWIRIDPKVQLLDSPGIIPAKQVRRSTAQFLAQFPAQFGAIL